LRVVSVCATKIKGRAINMKSIFFIPQKYKIK